MKDQTKLIIRHTLAFLFLLMMIAAAEFSGTKEIIFPEMVALVTGFWIAEKPPWRAGPVKTVALMTVCALAGVLLARADFLLWGKVAVGYVAVAAILILWRTNLYPLISACILPIMIDTEDFFYVGVVFTLSVILMGGRALFKHAGLLPEEATPWDDAPETDRKDALVWLITIVVFLVYTAYPLSFGNPYFVAPPLIVAYTAMMQPDCPLLAAPVKAGGLMALCAVTGFLARSVLVEMAHLPLAFAAGVALALYFAYMALLGLRNPPAGAALFLPLLLPAAGLEAYPVLMTVSTVLLTLICFICRGVINDE